MPNNANYQDRLASYITVNERIDAFYAKYPEGSLQSEMVMLTDTIVVFKASAFRTADDAKPGIGHSSLAIPGTTPYTRGSEIENAETSAWGRALAALGFEVKRGIASRDEIDNKANQQPVDNHRARTKGGPVIASEAQRKLLLKSAKSLLGEKDGPEWVVRRMKELGIEGFDDFDIGHWQMLLNELNELRNANQQPPTEEADIEY